MTRGGAPPSHTRWSWNGGFRIYLGEEARSGDVVVAGRGQVSHRSLDCAALQAGRVRAMSRHWASGGFYTVPVELADRFVPRRHTCWREDQP